MTTKYITGTYIAPGYTVAAGVSKLIITPTGGVGGSGIFAAAYETIYN